MTAEETSGQALPEYWPQVEEAMHLYNDRKADETIAKCREIVDHHPQAAEPYLILGLVAYFYRDEERAISLVKTAHDLEPDVREFAEVLATLCMGHGRIADGLYYAKLVPALTSHPKLATMVPQALRDLQQAVDGMKLSSHYIEALRLVNVGDFDRALLECDSEVRINPRSARAYALMGEVMIELGRYPQAGNAFRAAIHLEPEKSDHYASLAEAVLRYGQPEAAAAVARSALAMESAGDLTYQRAINVLARCGSVSLDELVRLRDAFEERLRKELGPTDVFASDDSKILPRKKIKVGVVSNCLFDTPDNAFFTSLLRHHSQSGFEFAAYPTSPRDDMVTTGFQSKMTSTRFVHDLDVFTAAEIVRTDDHDILLVASSPFAPQMLTIAAQHPAPVVIGFDGIVEPALTPLADVVLTDQAMVEHDRGIAGSSRRCVIVDGGLYRMEPFRALATDSPLPVRERGFVLFGSICDITMVGPETAATFARILRAVPGSRLLLNTPRFVPERIRASFNEMFGNFGVVDRIMMPEEEQEMELAVEDLGVVMRQAFWKDVDIFLDPFPVNARQELFEALWSGVPVVTLAGGRRAGLIGKSVITTAGRPEWIADTPENYERIAVSLAGDIDALEAVRQDLQKAVPTGPLFDTIDHTRALERALREAIGRF